MIQIDPPTPDLHVRDRRPRGRGSLLAERRLLQHAVQGPAQPATSATKVGEAAQARRPAALQGNPEAGALFMSHVGVEPIPESRLVTVTVTHTSPKEAALWANTLADVYIESTLEARMETARKAARVAAGAAHRDPEQHARGPEQALPELPEPGPLRARGIGLRGEHLHHPAQRRLHRRAHPPHHHRGRGAAGARHARPRAKASTRCPRWRPTR